MGEKRELEIDTPFLIKYISEEISRHHPSKKIIPYSGGDSVLEQLRFLNELWSLMPDTLTYGMSYCFSDLQDKNIRDLCSLAQNHRSYELACHILQPRYRSHHTHSMLVGILGWWALNNMCHKGKRLLKRYEKLLADNGLDGFYSVWDVWWLVALCHDMGYSISLIWKRTPLLLDMAYQYGSDVGLITKQVDSLKPPIEANRLFKDFHDEFLRQLGELIRKIETISSSSSHSYVELRSLIHNQQMEYITNLFLPIVKNSLSIRDNMLDETLSQRHKVISYLENRGDIDLKKRKLKELDHGILSAYVAQMQLTDITNAAIISRSKIVRMLLTPIALHNIYQIPKKNESTGTKPLAADIYKNFDVFFLKFIDQLQEWGRGIVTNDMSGMLVESDRIILRYDYDKYRKNDDLYELEGLGVVFAINNNNEVLEKTSWAVTKFIKGKVDAFGTFKAGDNTIKINISAEVRH